MTTGAPRAFDVCGALPGAGVTVLEASAGTGKTFTIAALVARLVGDGVPLSAILAVTFTRMATGELRDRVRARLVSAEEGLGDLLETGQPTPREDHVLCLLAVGTEEEVRRRREHLADALAVFDAATITTTHGFCQLVLAGMGVAGDVADGATLLEDPRDLVDQVVDDLYVRKALGWANPAFSRKIALDVGRRAVANPDTPLEPAPGGPGSGDRGRLAEAVRGEVGRRLLDANFLTYDDLLVRLKNTLAHPERGEQACARLRDRYQVVLVDEFQDTDPVQWEVVHRAFGTGATRLVLIGDPKQAIYAFRGADVYAYLEAADLADQRFTLLENWRSDRRLLDAHDALLEPLRLGHPDIPYRMVSAAPTHHRAGLEAAPVEAGLRARVLHSRDHDVRLTSRGLVQKGAALEWVAADLAGDVVGLLGSGAQLVWWSAEGTERHRRPVAPGDLAVLVRTNRQAGLVHRALRAAGVPAVVAGTESVFATPAARHWLRLLEALEQPTSRARAVAVAITPFFGMAAEEAAAADERAWEEVHGRLHDWADVLRRGGVAPLMRALTVSGGLLGRVLAEREGERELTDLGHVAQLLHAEASADQLGPAALRAWLARRIDQGADEGAEAEERSRRLDSDADAVQVLTVHRAKGLEFPIVYCPYLWDAGGKPAGEGPVVFHDATDTNRRKLDVGGATEGARAAYDRHVVAQHLEDRGEDLRHLYVALTRARNQTVVWWARTQDCQHSPLGRLLMSRQGDGTVAANGARVPKDREVHEALVALAGRAPGCISVERPIGAGAQPSSGDEAPAPLELGMARLARSLDLHWRRTSYSGITAAADSEAIGSEPESPGITDERDTTSAVATEEERARSGESESDLRAVPAPLGGMPGGAEVGTLLHNVLERVDFAAEDLGDVLRAVIEEEQPRHGVELGDTATVVGGLLGAISTPMGPLAGNVRLADLARADRLDELGFELPLAGGDRPAGEVLIDDIARLFADHIGPSDPLDGYDARLRDPLLATHLRGYLSGSLDLVFRLPVAGGPGDAGPGPRFFVVDYKSNWLGAEGEPLSAWHYRPAALDAHMQRAHYPLQAVLYMVALHRYLRWRLPAYRPETNLGGVLYLFLRGMVGAGTPVVDGQPCGVFSWPVPVGLVTGLSDLLAGPGGDPALSSHPGGNHPGGNHPGGNHPGGDHP